MLPDSGLEPTGAPIPGCWLCIQRERVFRSRAPECKVRLMEGSQFFVNQGLPNKAPPCLVFEGKWKKLRPFAWINMNKKDKVHVDRRPLGSLIDPVFAKRLIEDCQKHHLSQCSEKAGDTVMDMVLLDCHTLQIIKESSSVPYIALSYVWGREQKERLLRKTDGSLILDSLSRTIQDALSFTLRLGFRYLWVDKLCIDQSDSSKKHDQVMNMHRIYAGAKLTLVAAAGENEDFGLPGVRTQSREWPMIDVIEFGSRLITPLSLEIQEECHNSRWMTRGWTLQEAFLSKRILVFLETQAVFECSRCTYVESAFQSSAHDQGQTCPPVFERIFPSKARHWSENEIIENYTMRSLRYDSDSFSAFAGIAGHFRQQQYPLLNFCGILLTLHKMFNLDGDGPTHAELNDALAKGLCWSHKEKQPENLKAVGAPYRRRTFPSWTWVGWCGAADMFPFPRSQWEPLLSPSVKLRAVELTDTSKLSVENLLKPGALSKIDASKVCALHLDALFLRPESIDISYVNNKGISFFKFSNIGYENVKAEIDGKETTFILSEEFVPEDMIDRVRSGHLRIMVLQVCNATLKAGTSVLYRFLAYFMIVRKEGDSYYRVGSAYSILHHMTSAQDAQIAHDWVTARSETCPIRLA